MVVFKRKHNHQQKMATAGRLPPGCGPDEDSLPLSDDLMTSDLLHGDKGGHLDLGNNSTPTSFSNSPGTSPHSLCLGGDNNNTTSINNNNNNNNNSSSSSSGGKNSSSTPPAGSNSASPGHGSPQGGSGGGLTGSSSELLSGKNLTFSPEQVACVCEALQQKVGNSFCNQYYSSV